MRANFLYYFLRGSSTQDRAVAYNGTVFPAGSLDTNADFYRVSLAYERTLLSSPSGERLVGSAGLTVWFVAGCASNIPAPTTTNPMFSEAQQCMRGGGWWRQSLGTCDMQGTGAETRGR